MSTAQKHHSDKHNSDHPHHTTQLTQLSQLSQLSQVEELGKRAVFQRKRKERTPLSVRFKFNSPQTEGRQLEPKVRGWDTYADEFVDFT